MTGGSGRRGAKTRRGGGKGIGKWRRSGGERESEKGAADEMKKRWKMGRNRDDQIGQRETRKDREG